MFVLVCVAGLCGFGFVWDHVIYLYNKGVLNLDVLMKSCSLYYLFPCLDACVKRQWYVLTCLLSNACKRSLAARNMLVV